MSSALYPVLEREIPAFDVSVVSGKALARAVYDWNVPALNDLQGFFSLGADAFADVFGNDENMSPPAECWFSASVGLQAVRHALSSLSGDLTKEHGAEHVVADLEAVEAALLLAQKHDVRFHFAMDI